MRQDAAFRFIPELIGDFEHVMEMSKNPSWLYIEAAVDTLNMAGNVFRAIEEHTITRCKKDAEQTVRAIYSDLERKRIKNFEEEEVRKIDIAYEKVKIKIRDGQFKDKEVQKFIKFLKQNLNRCLDLLKKIQMDPDYPERAKIEELTRRTFRDYNKLLTVYIGEEEKYGQNYYKEQRWG